MKARTTARGIPSPSRTRPCIGVVGPYRWSRDLLVAALSSRLKAPVTDLGHFDEGLAARMPRGAITVLVVDAPGGASIPFLQRIHRQHPETKLIALSIPGGDRGVVPLIQRGVSGYVPPDAEFDELISDLRLFHRTHLACTPRVASTLIRHIGGNSSYTTSLRVKSLSPREVDIAKLLEEGLPNKLIADHLNISLGTVKNHIHRILQKLSLQKRAEIPRCLPQLPRKRSALAGTK